MSPYVYFRSYFALNVLSHHPPYEISVGGVISGRASPWKCLCTGGAGIKLGLGEETWVWLCQLSLGRPRTQSEREGRAICPGLARHTFLGSIPQACLPGVSSQPWFCADSACSQFASLTCSSRLQVAMIASLQGAPFGLYQCLSGLLCTRACEFLAHLQGISPSQVPLWLMLTHRTGKQGLVTKVYKTFWALFSVHQGACQDHLGRAGSGH